MTPGDRPDGAAPGTPAAAWRGLREGNARFVAGESLHPDQDASLLVEQSRVLEDAVVSGDVAVVGVLYHLADGRAELVHGLGTALPED